MYSELVGISLDGRLYQWKWSSEQPFSVSINLSSISFNETQLLSNNQVIINHPKTIFLQLINEKICGISTSSMRASCWTESGKVIFSKDKLNILLISIIFINFIKDCCLA